jgi:iron(III) transport system ATP-binding protein
VIELRGLGKRFGERVPLDDVTLTLARGAVLAVTGRSGCGKTTLLRLIAGLELPDSGEIVLDGVVASGPGWALAPHRRGVGFMFQAPALWPHMTVTRNILFGLGRLPRAIRARRLDEVLSLTHSDRLADRLPHQLSGGEARRVALARTLAPEPSILLLDEPLTHLDPELKAALRDVILEQVRRTGATLLYVTHDLAEFDGVDGRVLTLADGRLA